MSLLFSDIVIDGAMRDTRHHFVKVQHTDRAVNRDNEMIAFAGDGDFAADILAERFHFNRLDRRLDCADDCPFTDVGIGNNPRALGGYHRMLN